MKTIIVKSQSELDALPKYFSEYTQISIESSERVVVDAAWGNSSVVACGNSSVVARENSSVVACGNSSVEAWGNSSVVAWENSSVVAWENSSVVACGNSSVVACENSSVEAWGNSSVEARENSSVVAWENSSVVAWGNSSVVACENSSVEAWENSVVRVMSLIGKLILHGFSVAFLPVTINLNIKKQSEHAHIQVVKPLSWFENNGIEKTEKVTLYKRVSADLKTQEGTKNETTWQIGTTLMHPAWNPESGECGGGKYHACARPYFADEFRSTRGDRYVAIEIDLADIHEWPNPRYPHKIAFRKGKVLYECDKYGNTVREK